MDVKILGDGELTKKLTVTAHASRRPRARRSRPPAAPSSLLEEPKVQEGQEARSRAAPRGEPTSVEDAPRRPPPEPEADAEPTAEPDEPRS